MSVGPPSDRARASIVDGLLLRPALTLRGEGRRRPAVYENENALRAGLAAAPREPLRIALRLRSA